MIYLSFLRKYESWRPDQVRHDKVKASAYFSQSQAMARCRRRQRLRDDPYVHRHRHLRTRREEPKAPAAQRQGTR